MPLEILAPLVFGGIVLAVILVRMLVNTQAPVLETDADAIARLQVDYPNAVSQQVWISKDKRSALIALEAPQGTIGYVGTHGAKYLTRLLAKPSLKEQKASQTTVTLFVDDFTLGEIVIVLQSKEITDAVIRSVREVMK